MTGEVEEVIEKTEEQEADDFEAAFNEEAEKREGDAPADVLDDEPEPAPAEEPAPGDTPEVVAEGDAPAADAVPEEDPFEGWPQAAIDKYKEQVTHNEGLQHRIDSDTGRVGAFQRKINGLEATIAEIQKGPGEQPTNEQITAAMGTDEGWDQFKEDYPEVAEAIDARLDNKLGEVNTKIAPVVQKAEQDAATEAEAAQNEAYGEVAKTYPSWQTAVQEDNFQNWMATQPPGTQALAASDDPRDASLLIGQYDEHRVATGLPTLKADHVPDDTVVDDKSDEVAKRRAQQLEDGVTIESKKARIDPSAESGGEFEQAFDVFAKRQADKQTA